MEHERESPPSRYSNVSTTDMPLLPASFSSIQEHSRGAEPLPDGGETRNPGRNRDTIGITPPQTATRPQWSQSERHAYEHSFSLMYNWISPRGEASCVQLELRWSSEEEQEQHPRPLTLTCLLVRVEGSGEAAPRPRSIGRQRHLHHGSGRLDNVGEFHAADRLRYPE